MLGHQNIATTQKYLGVNYQNVRDAVEAMAVNSQLHINDILGSSIKNTSDEALILELALRGYDLTKLQTKNNNELVKLHNRFYITLSNIRHYNELVLNFVNLCYTDLLSYDRRLTHDQFSRSQG